MPSAVLIVASTRVHVDAPEILRIQDTIAALLKEGCAVSKPSSSESVQSDPAPRVAGQEMDTNAI